MVAVAVVVVAMVIVVVVTVVVVVMVVMVILMMNYGDFASSRGKIDRNRDNIDEIIIIYHIVSCNIKKEYK